MNPKIKRCIVCDCLLLDCSETLCEKCKRAIKWARLQMESKTLINIKEK